MGERLIDTRFTTKCDGIEDLVKTVDIDDVDDLETLLMFQLLRPVRVYAGWDEDEGEVLDLRVAGNEITLGLLASFPVSVAELARECAEMAQKLGPHTLDDWAAESRGLWEFCEDELISALRDALGKVGLFNLLED